MPDWVLTPATWESRKHQLQTTKTGLFQLVGWYGSTHQAAMWRKAVEFLAVFKERHLPGFDPQLTENWSPAYAAVEAEVLAKASVLVIRLENHELLNGSLGSIAEIGMALTSAALRGQIVVISIEDELLISLSESGAIAQYMILEMFLERWERTPELAGLLRVHRGNHLAKLAEIACDAAAQQLSSPQACVDFQVFLTKKARRRHNYPQRVLLGGSGGPYTPAHETAFKRKKEILLEPYLAEGQMVKVLSEGAIADAWNIPYGSVDKLGVALATRTLLSIESEYKREADILLLPIMTEAASKAAATEIGLLLVNALITGQWVKVYMEPFDPVDFLHYQLKDVDIESCTTEKEMRLALQKAGVDNDILALAVRQEVEDTAEILRRLMHEPEEPTLKEVQLSLLGQTPAFSNADNIRRVRALVEAHLACLSADHRFDGFFEYATCIEKTTSDE
jgi:hypothetical protein